MLFWNADKAFSDEFRNQISFWLQRYPRNSPALNLSEIFVKILDRLFHYKKNLINLPFLIRVSTATTIATITMGLVWIVLRPAQFQLFFSNFETSKGLDVMHFPLIIFLANMLADILSLLETRWVIEQMGKVGMRGKIGYLIFDIFLTAAFLCWIFLIYATLITILFLGSAFFQGFLGQSFDFSILVDIAVLFHGLIYGIFVDGPMLRARENGFSFGIFFYSTFFTSLWVWMYFLSWAIIRLAARGRHVLVFLQWALPIKERPLRAIGEVAATMFFIIYSLVALIVKMF